MKMDLRHTGRALQGLGCAFMIAGLAGALGTGAWADAGFLAPIHRALLAVAPTLAQPSGSPSSSPSPAPSGLPGPTPTPKVYQVPRGGRLRVNLNGSLTLGARSSSQTQYNVGGSFFGPSPSASPSPGAAVTTTQSASQGAVGMLAEVSRRTAATSLDFRIPFGFSTNGKASFGAFNLLYSTSNYAIGFGAQSASVLGQLPSGTTMRGMYVILPAPGGDLTFINGPTVGAAGEIIPLQALRYRGLHGREIYEASFQRASGPATGRSSTALFGVATSRGNVTAVGEIALQSRPGGDASPSGPSYQFRVDDGSLQTYFTAINRHLAAGYLSYGAGEVNGDDYTDIGFHRSGQTTAFSFDASAERTGTGTPGLFTTNRQVTATFTGPFKLGAYSLSASSVKAGSTDGAGQWTGSLQAQASAGIGPGFLVVSSMFNRQTVELGSTVAQVGYNAVYQRPIKQYSIGFSLGAYRQMSQAFGNTSQVSEGFNIARQYLKTSYGVAGTLNRTFGALSNAQQRNTQIYVTRQISPIIALQGSYQITSLRDQLNPSANGKSSGFSLSINAPFSFGNGIVSGRPDPHLPATIIGRVLTDVSSNPTFASLVSNGLNNVQVVLDDKVVQRTDLNGEFQFSFVSPGQHQLRIETASLPRGVTVDIPVYTLQVDGGQTAQISFLVGAFGGIQGHVYGRDDHGAIVPLPNVLLRVDGATYSQTDATGTFGFGKLRPGKHTVTVIENSVPAFATFDESRAKKEVEVKNGAYTLIDFAAEPLGSIAGTVLFDKDVLTTQSAGVSNAYVVAEPGEHAAIVDNDGSFIIDNLPPGDYTVSVDPETIPEGLGAGPESISVSLSSKEHYEGAAFAVGHLKKKVVFSFSAGGSGAGAAGLPKVRISETRLPPRGIATLTVDAPKSAGSVTAHVFDGDIALTYSEARSEWVGQLQVPTSVKVGIYEVTAKAANGTQPEAATITVDAKMPVALMQMDPSTPSKGQYVRVRARFLVDAAPGDRIQWEDGQVTTLGRPLVGRVFTFNLRYSLRPLHGLLLTRVARLPISLM